MIVVSSRRPDFSQWHSWHRQWLTCHRDKSGRRELVTCNYATNHSHPFSCSYPVLVVGSEVGSTVVFPGAPPAPISSLVAWIANVGHWCTKSPSVGDHSTTGVSGYAFWCESIAITSGASAVHRVHPMHFLLSTVICIARRGKTPIPQAMHSS